MVESDPTVMQAAVEMQEHARVANELRAATLANQLEVSRPGHALCL